MTPEGVEIVERRPTAAEYRDLCVAVGWEGAINLDAAPAALAGSLTACVALERGEIVGMARLVGDGAIFFYVQDVAVRPSHQGRGIGAALLGQLLGWVRTNAPDKAFVGLFAASGTEPFYRREGLDVHPELIGMFGVTPLRRRV